jgi:hypothetical protein
VIAVIFCVLGQVTVTVSFCEFEAKAWVVWPLKHTALPVLLPVS